ncbi:hypothetical protein ACA910_013345 [Epithemia clementina (nom. ined.)]
MTREVLHVGLGSEACHVSAHLLNLQGLSVTSSSSSSGNETRKGPSCDPSVTHTAFQRVFVPRVLFIDEAAESGNAPSPGRVQSLHSLEDNKNKNSNNDSNTYTAEYEARALSLEENQNLSSFAVWSGSIERLDRKGSHPGPATGSSLVADARESATQLSFASHSRYRVPTQMFQNQGSYSISSNNRTVDWDDLPEEEAEEEEDDDDRRQSEQCQETHWKQHVYPQIQEQLETFWDNVLTPVSALRDDAVPDSENAAHGPELASTNQVHLSLSNLSWRDFWMPPCHPNSSLDIPLSGKKSDDSRLDVAWSHYYPISQASESNVLRSWIEDEFLDRIRQMLEDCDSCQGFNIASSGHGAYAGLTTQLLQYLKDDCPAARRFVWSISENASSAPRTSDSNAPSWRTQRIEQARTQMEVGLMWHDYMDAAHAVLDLQLPAVRVQRHALFHNSAILAAALEAATLPYRLAAGNSSLAAAAPSSRIGLKSYYYGDFSGDSSFGSVSRMSFSDFLTNLQPSPGLSVLELDAYLPTAQDGTVWARLQEATNLERDQRIKYQPQLSGTRRPRDNLPGLWMMGTSQGGLLSPLSPNRADDRSVHTHFALASSFRYESSSTNNVTSSSYVDCLMEGMGIRYRPEQSFATHLNESLSSLTTSSGYSAGSYWKHAWGPKPVLSVLGNTTRFFAQAAQIGAGVKQVLSRQSRGFFNRDVANEILPEEDNCHEVLSTIYNLRDKYQPPRGSIEEDDDGLFMD